MVIMLVPTHFNHYNCTIVKDKSSLIVHLYSLDHHTYYDCTYQVYSSAGLVENDE